MSLASGSRRRQGAFAGAPGIFILIRVSSWVVQLQRRLFTTDEYFRMVEAGILREDGHLELIEGEIVEMPPAGNYHAGLLSALTVLFRPVLGIEAVLRHQDPLRLNSQSAPEPGFAVVKFRPDFYA